jgi:hypothetical protein
MDNLKELEVQNIPFHEYMKDDGQKFRSICNYLVTTYESIHGHKFSDDGKAFESDDDFFRYVSDVCQHLLEIQ